MKIVINGCFGGFGLSEAAFKELGVTWDGYGYMELTRNDPRLVAGLTPPAHITDFKFG